MDFSQLQGQQQQKQMNPQQQQQYNQAQATINRDKSIVVKTLPDSVIDEFRNANISRVQRSGGQPADAFNPFAQEQQQPMPAVEQQPMYAQQQGFEQQQPMQSFQQQQPVIQQRAQAPPPPMAPAAPVVAVVDPREQEVKQLVGIVSGCLRKELESGSRTPVTIGLLSSKIKNLTGKSWGGYWQENHGQLTKFIKEQPNHFVLFRNKYVVLIGHENDVDIPTDNPMDKLSVSKGANGSVVRREENKPVVSSTASAAMSSSVSASQMRANAAQSFKSILPMEATTGLMFPSSAPQQQQPGYGMYGNQQQQQQPMYNMGQQQQGQYGQQQQPNMYNNNMQQQQQPVNGGYPVAPQQQQQQQMFGQTQPAATPATNQGSFDPFAAPAPVSAAAGGAGATAPAGDDWWSQGGGASGGDNNAHLEWASPLEGFEDTSVSSDSNAKAQEQEGEEEAVSAKELEKQRERERKEQERKDEEFAKQLQDEEYASQGVTNSTSSRQPARRASQEPTVQPIKGSYVTLPAAQIRDLAEKEIGKENIRILARFSVKKYGREGRPHQRKMWVTAGLTHLAWDSTHSDGARRGVQFSQVSEIMVGYRTPTIERWTKDARKVALCFSLVTPSRTLDLQACSVIQRDELVAALRKVVKFNRRHKPKMIDRWTTQILIED